MRKLTIFLFVVAGLLGTTTAASAARWTATEVQAEAWARGHVVYVDHAEIAHENQQLADLKASRDQACTTAVGAPPDSSADMQCRSAKQQYNAELGGWNASGRGHYRPASVDCRGASPSRDAYHFYRFRCRAQFTVGWGNILVTITGRNRTVWRWLP
jgi:hypothetical protein